MATAIGMPKLGITMEEGTVVEWPHAIGDRVEKGAVVLIIESEKAEVEIEASVSGVVRHYFAEPGDTLPCGALLGAITPTEDEAFDPVEFERAYKAERADDVAASPRSSPTPAKRRPVHAAPRLGNAPATPAARVRARALGLDIVRVPGSGPGGRITREDVDDWAKRREQLVTVAEGVALDVPQQGDGDTVALLPGLGTDVSAFARQIPVLANEHHVYGINPRGVAGSDAPEQERYAIADAARDAATVLGDAAHVIGASLGAAVALELALEHPDRVRSLTLITPFLTVDARLKAVSESWARLAGTVTSDLLARSLLPWFFSPGFLADDANRERTVRGLATTCARVPAATLERMVLGLQDWSGTREGDLARVTIPTLVVVAEGDLLTPGATAIADAIPGARCVVIPRAGHAVTIESPEAVNDALLAHLAGNT